MDIGEGFDTAALAQPHPASVLRLALMFVVPTRARDEGILEHPDERGRSLFEELLPRERESFLSDPPLSCKGASLLPQASPRPVRRPIRSPGLKSLMISPQHS